LVSSVHVEDLTNVGRESHTYLYHVYKHYDILVDNNDTTALIFLQGGFTDHLHTWFRGFNTPSEMIKAFLSDTGCARG
jgi:hypothetical protein